MRPIYYQLLLTLIIIVFSCSDSKTKEQSQTEEKTTATVATAKTDKHVKIPNSHLYIIPPSGFAADELTGTVAQTEGAAHFMQMQILSGYTPNSLFATMKAEADKNFPGSWKEEAITVSGHTATIYHSKNAAYMQYYFAFTDGYTDEMIIANYEEKHAATGTAMKEAMKTVVATK